VPPAQNASAIGVACKAQAAEASYGVRESGKARPVRRHEHFAILQKDRSICSGSKDSAPGENAARTILLD